MSRYKGYTPVPLKPYTPKPLKPYTPKPLKPYKPKPLKDYTPKPLKPYTPKPLKPYTPKSLKPYTPKPLKPYTPVPCGGRRKAAQMPPPAEPYKSEKCPWCGEMISLATDGRRMVCKYCGNKVRWVPG